MADRSNLSRESDEQPPTFEDIKVGTVWRVPENGFEWKVIQERYDGAGTFRVVMLNRRGEPTTVYDTVWTDEILECERVR